MAIATTNKLEAEMTPAPPNPTIQVTEATYQPQEIQTSTETTKTCASKQCIHKKTDESKETTEKSVKKKDEDDSESDSSDSDSSSSEDEKDATDAESSESEDEKKSKKSKSRSKKVSKSKSRKDKSSSKKRKGKKAKKGKSSSDDSSSGSEEDDDDKSVTSATSSEISGFKSILKKQGMSMSKRRSKNVLASLKKMISKSSDMSSDDESDADDSDSAEEQSKSKRSKKSDKKDKKSDKKSEKKKKVKKASKSEFKRLDEIWDEELYDYKLKETSEEKKEDKYEEYIFLIRRKFDNENHYEETVVDIKSELLKECLQKIMGECEGVSLVEETPHLEPNMLFLFLEDMREMVTELKTACEAAKKKKEKKAITLKAKHLEKMVEYLDKDFDKVKKSLYPLLATGKITFELLWALYRPGQLAYTMTYGDDTHPRAFKIMSCYKQRSFQRGIYYEVEGRYLDFDGKSFGFADSCSEVPAFQGTRKITSLACYPLKYHPDVKNLKPQLIERGKKFLTLGGMNYRNCKGMGYLKKECKILKASVNGRIMIDAATFRRVNPNYPLNDIEPKHIEVQDEDDDCNCVKEGLKKAQPEGVHYRLVKLDGEEPKVVEVTAEEQAALEEHVDTPEKQKDITNTFTEEELLTASPVLPGFSFSEKSWLEFAVSDVSDVTWNEGAFDALVLPEKHKSIVKALVSAHGLHSGKGIDDVIAGKGKGLVAVLHGRPGLGKTLTCEAVSDLLKRPLYTVSAGDLGTNPSHLETELQTILEIAHTWGAVLLMDEADVFLEERSIHDVHRNALVSIFLRLLEYFQGILFLTTNRVATFDEAFVSRIHLSLRYGDLTMQAKKSVWKTFIDKVRTTEGSEVGVITENDYDVLARHDINGRQIKNLVKTAQALALHEQKPMTMEHIRKVIDVARSFENDLKGGLGFEEAMRSYT